MVYSFQKRLFDLAGALVLAVLISPLFVLVASLVYLTSTGPILYKARRVGLHGREFVMYKFRTMVVNADRIGGASTALNDPRLTSYGRFLRKTKLDEIPQLLNILKGDMSFVGPRPQVKIYTSKYSSRLLPILSVLPGITDIASLVFYDMDSLISAADSDSYYEKYIEPQKNEYRLYYSKNFSFSLDFLILLFTILSLFSVRASRFFESIINDA